MMVYKHKYINIGNNKDYFHYMANVMQKLRQEKWDILGSSIPYIYI